jgi:hypothetical protein
MFMHRVIAVLIMLPILAPKLSSGLAARSSTDWDKVKRLKRGSAIEVLPNDGRYLRGSFLGASDAGLEISIVDSHDPQFSFTQDVDRANIRRIIEVQGRHRADAKRWMITGAVGGDYLGWLAGQSRMGCTERIITGWREAWEGRSRDFLFRAWRWRWRMEWRRRRAGDERRWFMRMRAKARPPVRRRRRKQQGRHTLRCEAA